MKSATSTSLTLLAISTISLAEYTRHAPIKLEPLESRQLDPNYMTCEQTYGAGSIICGDPDTSHFCYDPSKGEICCLMDNGYCKAGDFCAPVVGFCCHNGEDPRTCSIRLSFTLPASLPTSIPAPLEQAATAAIPTPSLPDALPLGTPIIGIETPTSATPDSGAEGGAETSTIELAAATAANTIANTIAEILPASQNGFVEPTSVAGNGNGGSTRVGNGREAATSTSGWSLVPESTAIVNGTGGVNNGTGAGEASTGTGIVPDFVGGASAVVGMGSVGSILGVVAGLMMLL